MTNSLSLRKQRKSLGQTEKRTKSDNDNNNRGTALEKLVGGGGLKLVLPVGTPPHPLKPFCGT